MLRSPSGSWRSGFRLKLGCCTIDEAEAWGILQGLDMASRHGVQNLIVESDSKSMIDLLKGSKHRPGGWNNIVPRCITMSKRFANIQFVHVYREQNRIADTLAKQAFTQPTGITMLNQAPSELRELIREEQMGAQVQRRMLVGPDTLIRA